MQICTLQVRNALPFNEENEKGNIQLRNSPDLKRLQKKCLKSPANQRKSRCPFKPYPSMISISSVKSAVLFTASVPLQLV